MKQTLLPATPVDNPLPSKVLGSYGGWGNRAQQYPIFSLTWLYYRLLSYMLPLLILAVFLGMPIFVIGSTTARQSLVMVILLAWCSVAMALVLGRCGAVMVLRRSWPDRRRTLGVVVAIVAGIVVALTLAHFESRMETQFTHEYRQELAQKRQSDVSLIDTDSAFESSPMLYGVRLALQILIYMWLGGALDLLSWFRQRKAMADIDIEQRLAQYQKERNEAELRLSVLASQVEPHFLFNTLSGVRSAILSDPQMGVAIIDNLVEYLRATIPQLRNDGSMPQVRLAAQMQAIRAYLGVIKFRIPRLTFVVDYDPALADLTIPPLMLISLVENAVKHGVELKKGPVSIAVRAQMIEHDGEHKLALSVVDDGIGFSGVTSGSGIGLSNIRERLQQLYQNTAALTLETNASGGVTAQIVLPTPIFS